MFEASEVGLEKEDSYQVKTDAAIRDVLHAFECQPILFVGSGISRRYFGAPNWQELLKKMFALLPDGDSQFEYHRQKFDGDLIKIGTALVDLIFEWAWAEGRENFPKDLFSTSASKDVFLKCAIAEYFSAITPTVDQMPDELKKEIVSFSEIRPHAIITTNYDLFLENIFDGYETITGQTILKYNTNSFGEVFHIHGDVTDPRSIILTSQDYSAWGDKKKYVSAKLLTYFAEHPVFIFGYSLGDPNVKSILCDIGELVSDDEGLIQNVYQVVWHKGKVKDNAPDQAIISLNGREYRVRAIHTSDFKWVFDALKSRSALTSINPKLVRALAARMMKLVRHDIPSGSVEVNYDVLEQVAQDRDHLPTLLGITSISNPNQSHPFTITQITARIGLPNWQATNRLITKIKDEKGIDLRSTDNRYHCKIKTGSKSASHKWSHESVDLFKLVSKNMDYEVIV